MERKTDTVIRHRFIFTSDETSHLGLESQRCDYMKTEAIKHLKNINIPESEDIVFSMGEPNEDSTITICFPLSL
jgi:hypothetical protein